MDQVDPPALDAALAHAGFVRGLARALLGADRDVDDVVQETWLAAARGGPRDPSRWKGWLAGVVRRKSASVYRKRATERRHHERLPDSPDAPSTAEVMAKEEMRREVVTAMLELDEPYRSALLLRYYEDLPPREVARRLEVPVETARTRIKRGLAKLRAELDRRPDGRRGWTPLVASLAGFTTTATAGMGGALALAAGLAAAVAITWFSLRPGDDHAPPPAWTDAADTRAEPSPGPSLAVRGPDETMPEDTAPAGRTRLAGFVRRGGRPLSTEVLLWYVGSAGTDFRAHVATTDREQIACERAPDRRIETDARGRFGIEGIGPGAYVVGVRASDGSTWTRVVRADVDGATTNASLDLPAGGTALDVTIRQADGRAWTGVLKAVLRDVEKGAREAPNLVAPTDANGRVVLAGLAADSAILEIHTPALDARRHVRLPHEAPLVWTVALGGHEVRGRVSARAGGAPVADAQVSARVSLGKERAWHHSETRRVRTDAQGCFQLAFGPGRGEINLTVEAPGYRPAHQEWDRTDEPLAFRLDPEIRIAGHVVDPQGARVPGARVVVERIGDRGRYASTVATAVSGKDGRFSIPVDRPGRLAVFVHAEGWASPRLGEARLAGLNPFLRDVGPQGLSDLRLDVLRLPATSGRLLDLTDRPIAGAVVGAAYAGDDISDDQKPLVRKGARTVTDEAGRFTLRDLVPGMSWEVTAQGPLLVKTTTPPIALDANALPLVIRAVRLDTARDLAVEVVDLDGRPIEGVHVRVLTRTERWTQSIRGLAATTDSAGRAWITPVPAGPALVDIGGPYVGRNLEARALPSSEGPRIEIRWRVARKLRIAGVLNVRSGTIEDLSPFAEIEARRGETRVGGRFHENTGRWSVEHVDAGRWDVVFTSGPHEARGSFEAGDENAELVLRLPDKAAGETPAEEKEPDRVVRYTLTSADGGLVPNARYTSWRGGGWSGGGVGGGVLTRKFWNVGAEVMEFHGAKDAAGGRLALGAVIFLPGESDEGDVAVRLPPERRIEGVVRIGGAPSPAGVRVKASALLDIDGRPRVSPAVHDETTTDAEGRFTLRGLGPYTYALDLAGASALAPTEPITFEAGTTDAVLALRAAFTATLRIVGEDDEPLAGMAVRVLPPGARPNPFGDDAVVSDTAGMVRVPGLDPARTYRLSVSPPRGRHGVIGLRRKAWSPRDETLRLTTAYRAEGRVAAPDGSPVAKACLWRLDDGKRWKQAVWTDAEGRFVLHDVPRDGVTIQARRGEQVSAPRLVSAGATDVLLELDPGIDFRVEAVEWSWGRLDRASLSYVARDAAGERVEGSNWGSPGISQGGQDFVGRARNARWTFCWEHLPDGKIGWLEDVEVGDGDTVRVPILDPVELTGRVEIPDGVDPGELSVYVGFAQTARWAKPAADGTFRVTDLPPGQLRLRVWRRTPSGERLKGAFVRARPGEQPVLRVPTH